ncbi:MmcQ/YjbR family DNA-binding protein [Blastococcus sp. SYSU D00820]
MAADWTDEERAAVQARVRALAHLPGVEAEETAGHTGFAVRGRRFAWLQVDHHGDGRLALVVKAPPEEGRALLASRPCWFVPAYLGSRGWVGVDLSPGSGADWDEVAEVLDQAWRGVAPKRLRAERDPA